jgi:hypothetical protein
VENQDFERRIILFFKLFFNIYYSQFKELILNRRRFP